MKCPFCGSEEGYYESKKYTGRYITHLTVSRMERQRIITIGQAEENIAHRAIGFCRGDVWLRELRFGR